MPPSSATAAATGPLTAAAAPASQLFEFHNYAPLAVAATAGFNILLLLLLCRRCAASVCLSNAAIEDEACKRLLLLLV
jgi:hypothetical protein